jgi:hypothetical protein
MGNVECSSGAIPGSSPAAWPWVSSDPSCSQVYTENVRGKAVSRGVAGKWGNEQAVYEAVTRMETIFRNWK